MSARAFLVLAALFATALTGCVNPSITPQAIEGTTTRAVLYADASAAVAAARSALTEAQLSYIYVEDKGTTIIVNGEMSASMGVRNFSMGGRGAVSISRDFLSSTKLTIGVTTRSRVADEAISMDSPPGLNFNDPRIAPMILDKIKKALPQDDAERLRLADERRRIELKEQEEANRLADIRREEQRVRDLALAEERKREAAAARARLVRESAEGSVVNCPTDILCRKAFALAQIYVSTKSDMKIQIATDTIIETYNPTEAGKLGAKVIKTPGQGEQAQISLIVSCKDDCPDFSQEYRYMLMRDFRSFIETRLVR